MNALEFAVKMELDGEKYYVEQAQLNKNNSVKTVCLILAKDEFFHAQILKKKMDGLEYELPKTDSYAKIKNIFKDIGNFESEIYETPTQLEFYRVALEKEKQSVDLYNGFLAKTSDIDEQNLFRYLVEQEKLHFSLLDELVTILRHSEEWVESAEFGLRTEEY
jgi:rubrerythrin